MDSRVKFLMMVGGSIINEVVYACESFVGWVFSRNVMDEQSFRNPSIFLCFIVAPMPSFLSSPVTNTSIYTL